MNFSRWFSRSEELKLDTEWWLCWAGPRLFRGLLVQHTWLFTIHIGFEAGVVRKDVLTHYITSLCKRVNSVSHGLTQRMMALCLTVIWGLCHRVVRDRPQGLYVSMSSLCQTRSSLCLFFVYPTYHIRKRKPGEFLRRKQSQARATTEMAVRRCECSTKEPIATNPSITKDSWASCGYGTLNCAILLKYELLRAIARRQFVSCVLVAILEPVFFFVQTFVDFALSLPGHSLWVCLHPGPWFFFSETTNTDKKWKLVPNAWLKR